MRKMSSFVVFAMVASLVGLVASPASAAVCNVPSGSYPTIQSAVNDLSCDPILVAPGTYPENVSINRSLTLDGAGSGATAADTIVQSVAANTPVISITAGGTSVANRLVLSDLRVTGAFAGGGGNPDSGVRLSNGATGFTTFDNVAAVMNTGNGIGIDQSAGSTVTDVDVIDSDLSDNGNSGLRVPTRVTLDGLDVSDSTLDRNDITGFTMFGSLLNSTIDSSTFNDNGGSTTTTNAGQGISLHGFDNQVNRVEDLLITDSQLNRNRGAHPTANVSTGLQFSSRAGDVFRNISIIDSVMDDNGRHGLRLEVTGNAILDNVNVQSGDITNNDEAGVTSFSAPAAPTDVTINENNITGNNGVGIVNGSAGAFDAECNWWGSSTGPAATDNPTGTGDAVVESPGDVDYQPWLVGPAPGGACTGVPPNPPPSKDACKKDGWMAFTDDEGRPFKNQGDCVSYFATGGTNKAAG